MSDLGKRGRGRKPQHGETMSRRFQMVMDDDLSFRLNKLSAQTGLSRADIFRKAFDLFEKGQKELSDRKVDDDYYEGYDDYYDEDYDDYDEFDDLEEAN